MRIGPFHRTAAAIVALVAVVAACGGSPARETTPNPRTLAPPETLVEVLSEPDPGALGLALADPRDTNPRCVSSDAGEGELASTRGALLLRSAIESCVVEYRATSDEPGNGLTVWAFLFATSADAAAATQSSRLQQLGQMLSTMGLEVGHEGRLLFYLHPEGALSLPIARALWPALRARVRAHAPLHVDQPRPASAPPLAAEPVVDESCSDAARSACQMRATDGMSCNLASAGCGTGGARCMEMRVNAGCECRCHEIGASPPP